MKGNLSHLIQLLLKENRLSIDSNELDFQIKSHPTYPSLNAITGVLDHFNLPNVVVDVPVTLHTLNQLPSTFITLIKKDFDEAYAFVRKTDKKVMITNHNNQTEKLSEQEFLDRFSGIVLGIESNENETFNPSDIVLSNHLSGGIIGLSVLFAFILLIEKNATIDTLLFFPLCLVGSYISLAIIKQEQGIITRLGNALCSGIETNNSCNSILNSKRAVIYKNFKISDLSLIVFVSLSIASFLLALNNSSLFSLQIIVLIALPVTLYSLYYQYVIFKKWCALCLCVVGILWLLATVSIWHFQVNFNIETILITLIVFGSISILWTTVSYLRKDYTALINDKIEFFKFKRNFEIFETQLYKSNVLDTSIADISEITFGNPNSKLEIVIITNPECGPCKHVHSIIEHILNSKVDLKLIVRFNIKTDNPQRSVVKITTRLLEIYHTEGWNTCYSAMNDAYSDFSSNLWFKTWGSPSADKRYLDILRLENIWCETHSINFTPEILINGRTYPNIYRRDDILFFLEDLVVQAP